MVATMARKWGNSGSSCRSIRGSESQEGVGARYGARSSTIVIKQIHARAVRGRFRPRPDGTALFVTLSHAT